MRNIAWALDAENEIWWGVVIPSLEAVRFLERIKRPVYFYRRKFAGGIFELAMLWKTGGVEDATPGRIAPARNSNSYFSHLANPSRTEITCYGWCRQVAEKSSVQSLSWPVSKISCSSPSSDKHERAFLKRIASPLGVDSSDRVLHRRVIKPLLLPKNHDGKVLRENPLSTRRLRCSHLTPCINQ